MDTLHASYTSAMIRAGQTCTVVDMACKPSFGRRTEFWTPKTSKTEFWTTRSRSPGSSSGTAAHCGRLRPLAQRIRIRMRPAFVLHRILSLLGDAGLHDGEARELIEGPSRRGLVVVLRHLFDQLLLVAVHGRRGGRRRRRRRTLGGGAAREPPNDSLAPSDSQNSRPGYAADLDAGTTSFCKDFLLRAKKISRVVFPPAAAAANKIKGTRAQLEIKCRGRGRRSRPPPSVFAAAAPDGS